MLLDQVESVLATIRGCTFASIDAETKPCPGIRKLTRNEVVLLFNTNGVSGYENMVRRRLEECGRDPSKFNVGDLPFGERVEGYPSCLIRHKEAFYLQTIFLKPGEVQCFLGRSEVTPAVMPELFNRDEDLRAAAYSQGLPIDRAVLVRAYRLDSLKEIRLQHVKITTQTPQIMA